MKAEKLYGRTSIVIPHTGSDGGRAYLRLTIDAGDEGIDRAKVYKGTRTYIRDHFNKKVTTHWVRTHCIITNEREVQETQEAPDLESREEKRRKNDLRYLQIQEAEDAYIERGYAEGQEPIGEEAAVEVPTMQEAAD